MAKEKYHFIFTPADGNAALPVAVGEDGGGHFIPVAEGVSAMESKYDEVRPCPGGFFIVRQGRLWGIADSEGDTILKIDNDAIDFDGERGILYNGGKWWHIKIEPGDWRVSDGSNDDLRGARLTYVQEFHRYSDGWDHEHCRFCFATIGEFEGEEHSAYRTDGGEWICRRCYGDFAADFEFELDAGSAHKGKAGVLSFGEGVRRDERDC